MTPLAARRWAIRGPGAAALTRSPLFRARNYVSNGRIDKYPLKKILRRKNVETKKLIPYKNHEPLLHSHRSFSRSSAKIRNTRTLSHALKKKLKNFIVPPCRKNASLLLHIFVKICDSIIDTGCCPWDTCVGRFVCVCVQSREGAGYRFAVGAAR